MRRIFWLILTNTNPVPTKLRHLLCFIVFSSLNRFYSVYITGINNTKPVTTKWTPAIVYSDLSVYPQITICCLHCLYSHNLQFYIYRFSEFELPYICLRIDTFTYVLILLLLLLGCSNSLKANKLWFEPVCDRVHCY